MLDIVLRGVPLLKKPRSIVEQPLADLSSMQDKVVGLKLGKNKSSRRNYIY